MVKHKSKDKTKILKNLECDLDEKADNEDRSEPHVRVLIQPVYMYLNARTPQWGPITTQKNTFLLHHLCYRI